MASSLPVYRATDDASWGRVIRQAACADSSLDPDNWFPVSPDPVRARRDAAAAIAVCTICLVRAPCLELSLRDWAVGQHGVWGGLIAADRARLRHRFSAGRRGPQHRRRFTNDRVTVVASMPRRLDRAPDAR